MTATAPLRTPPGSEARPDVWQRLARSLVEPRLAGIARGRLALREAFGTARATTVGPGGSDEPDVELRVVSPRFYTSLALGGSVGAAESYARGEWTCEDPIELVRLFVRNRDVLDGVDSGLSRLSSGLRRVGHALRPNSRSGSRRNIIAHYDLGNDFFEAFLDETLTYSCALFEREDATLAEASIAKLDRLCRKLDLRADDHLLEIGTGWGSMTLHAAGRYGCRVTTTTISPSQRARAAERIAAAGLDERVTLLERDYRDLRGSYDKLVSVEMIEAVGAQHLDTYVEACSRRLAADGLFALQAITIADQHYERARDEVDFIKRHVFPGSFIPSTTAILDAATRRTDLRLVHLEDMAPHYARTLRAWRANLLDAWDDLAARGYDETFLRMWDFYLCYCAGGFEERFLGVSQMLFAKPGARRAAVLPPFPDADAAP